MTDEQLALQAVSDAQRILEEYLEPRPRNNERIILDRLVEVLERPDLLVAVNRMQRVGVSRLCPSARASSSQSSASFSHASASMELRVWAADPCTPRLTGRSVVHLPTWQNDASSTMAGQGYGPTDAVCQLSHTSSLAR